MIALVALIGAIPLSAAAADQPLRLKPSSKWAVDYARDYCRLQRSFGTVDDQITVTLERFVPSRSFRFSLVGNPMRETNKRMKATLAFGVGEKPEQVDFVAGTSNNAPAWVFPDSLFLVSMDPATTPDEIAATESKINQIFIGGPLRNHTILETGSLGPPFAALRKCTDELLVDWGLDVERHSKIKRWATPTSDAGTWIKSSDYPMDMILDGQQAIVEFRLLVGTSGTVESCSITKSTHPDFNSIVCNAISKRAEFSPALDQDDQPMRSVYVSRVFFKLGNSRCDIDRNSAFCVKK